jgi:hypothetical protein
MSLLGFQIARSHVVVCVRSSAGLKNSLSKVATALRLALFSLMKVWGVPAIFYLASR